MSKANAIWMEVCNFSIMAGIFYYRLVTDYLFHYHFFKLYDVIVTQDLESFLSNVVMLIVIKPTHNPRRRAALVDMVHYRYTL